MRILLLHQFYLMPGMPGGSRFNELTRLWRHAGHDVTVVTGCLDYASGTVPERYRGRWVTREDDDGVEVFRCYVPATYNSSYAGRAWAFLGFLLSSSYAATFVRRPDVIIATSPPLTIAASGYFASRRHRRPWVFEIRDLWPESAVTTGVLRANGILTRVLYALERFACTRADAINVLTPAFADDLVARGLAPRAKMFFVPNGANPDEFTPGPRDTAFRREQGFGDRFVVMYAGAHGRANALSQLVAAAELLRDRSDIAIACVGDGPERAKLAEDARQRGLSNIVFTGAQPKSRMPEVVRACDVGAAVLQDNPTFRTVYPNKVFDYMACARPVLLAIDGVARQMVCDDAQAGLFVPPENPRALADGILALAADEPRRRAMGERGRAWVVANVSRESLARRYLAELESRFGRGRRR